jgi:MarR family transcriptional regulator, organic hydroperoxide resistance regulator
MTPEEQAASASLGYALAEGIYNVYGSLQRSVSGTLRGLDLTEALDPDDGPQSRRSLAARLHCDPSNVTLLVDRLEVRGLVESHPDGKDRRVKAIALTPTGRQVRDRLVATTADSPTFARLSQTERRQLARLLTRCGDPDDRTPKRPVDDKSRESTVPAD